MMIWTTGDGRRLRPEDFEDGHLTNVLYLLKTRAQSRLEGSGVSKDLWRARVPAIYFGLEAEARKRDLALAKVCAPTATVARQGGKRVVYTKQQIAVIAVLILSAACAAACSL